MGNWLDLLFPKKCVGCGKAGSYVCRECELGLWEEEQICPICCRPSRYGEKHSYCKQVWSMDGLTCFWAYEGIARKLIKNAKYKYYFDYLPYFAKASLGEQLINRPEFSYFREFLKLRPVLVPVPLFGKRLKERGFNQAEEIAIQLSKYWRLEVRNLIARIRDTGRQVGRTREERLEAMEGAFQITSLKSQFPNKVMLVDDVWTTGATMRECTKVLKEAGVRQVWGLVLAR